MSNTLTPNLGLKKPDYKDPRWDIPLNENFDIIDDIATQRNLILNGDMRIWQRPTLNTHINSTTMSTFGPDRMKSFCTAPGGDITLTTGLIDGYQSYKLHANTTVSDLTGSHFAAAIIYGFEEGDLYEVAKKGKHVTFSFLFKANISGKFCFAIRSPGYVLTYLHTFNVVGGQTKKVVIPVSFNRDFGSHLTPGSQKGFDITIGAVNKGSLANSTEDSWVTGAYLCTGNEYNWATVGTDIEIAKLTANVGQHPISFVPEPYAITEIHCQRYYQNISVHNYMYFSAAGNASISMAFPKMRDKPTVTKTGEAYSGAVDGAEFVPQTSSSGNVTIHYKSAGAGLAHADFHLNADF